MGDNGNLLDPKDLRGRRVELEVTQELKGDFVSEAICSQQCMLDLCGELGLILFYVYCVSYVMARIFLVVECLIALFTSVPDVFEEPSWSAYFLYIT